jgi:uncharacterized MAPEG superfamily protein
MEVVAARVPPCNRGATPAHSAAGGDAMTIDLWMLVASALLCLLIPGIYLAGRAQTPGGTQWGFGNRDTALAVPAWAARAERAHANLVENLTPFAIVVLTAHLTGKANATTAHGAELFFAGRVAHVLVYTAGIPYLRTAVFFVAAVGEIMILMQLFH